LLSFALQAATRVRSPNPRANEIQTAFEFGVSQLVKDGISLARGDYRILLKPFVSGWEVEYSRSSGERGGSRVYAFPSNGGLSASAIQPSNSGIEEAFKLGVEELAKEGCPFRRGEYTISIEPNGMGWEMRYSETPRRVNGDRLLIIQNRYVRVAPL
jgi:hypothetical protein